MVTRIRLSRSLFQKLQILKGRTGLTPNLLCRIALLSSLRDDMPLLSDEQNSHDDSNDDTDGVEMNLVTLFGEWEAIFEALVRQWCFEQEREVERLGWIGWSLVHIQRGVDHIYPRIKEPLDVLVLVSGKSGDQP